jgi:hypothetical protein
VLTCWPGILECINFDTVRSWIVLGHQWLTKSSEGHSSCSPISGQAGQLLSSTSITTSSSVPLSLEMASATSTLEYCHDPRAGEVARRNTYSPGDSAAQHINYQYEMTEYGTFAVETHGRPHDEYRPSHNDYHRPHDEMPKRTKYRRPSLSVRFGSFGWPHINISRRSSIISAPDSPSEIPSPPLPPMSNGHGGRVIEDVGIPNYCLSVFKTKE